MTKYVRLNTVHRARIESLHQLGHTQDEIAWQVGAAQSTISRELARLPGFYSAGAAQEHAQARIHVPTLVPLLDRCPVLVRRLRNYMHQRYSIAQALMKITKKYPNLPTITAAAVYNWLFSSVTRVKKELKKLMIRPRTKRRSRKKTVTGRGKYRTCAPSPSAQQVPRIAASSDIGRGFGDRESGRSAIATLVERKSRLTLLIKVKGRTTKEVVAAVARRLRRIGAIIKSITWDQGKELTDHAELERLIEVPVFFADAHSPWQRGSNENAQRRNKALATKRDQPERAPSSPANHPTTTQRSAHECTIGNNSAGGLRCRDQTCNGSLTPPWEYPDLTSLSVSQRNSPRKREDG